MAVSSSVLSIFRDGDFKTSLRNLFQCLITLQVNKYFFMFSYITFLLLNVSLSLNQPSSYVYRLYLVQLDLEGSIKTAADAFFLNNKGWSSAVPCSNFLSVT